MSDHTEGWFTAAEWCALSGKGARAIKGILRNAKEEGRLDAKMSVRINLVNNRNVVPVYRILREAKK